MAARDVTDRCRADDAEDRAVAFVEGLGGKVTRDDKLPGKPVITVNLSSTQATDARLKELATLKNLTTLNMVNTRVTDRTLAVLRAINLLHARSLTTASDGKRPTKTEDLKPACEGSRP